MTDPKPTKSAVALVLYHPDRRRLLLVKRPPDDGRLPNVWGLPAGSLGAAEGWEDAVVRAGREKLGVGVRIVREVAAGSLDRGDHLLRMKEYEVEIVDGTPAVPQAVMGITQYVEWRWGIAAELSDAAQRGSLCSRLYLGLRPEP